LCLPAGRCAVLVGASGAGKTTLLRIVLGTVVPDAGRVLVNGTDLAEMDVDSWLKHVAWLPQNPYILQGAMWENVLLNHAGGPENVDWAGLNALAVLSGLDRDVAKLPQGWRTRVDEDGIGLSGGQRQRLALTRTLAKACGTSSGNTNVAPVMLLDEPTAYLDKDSRRKVLAALRTLSGKQTLLIASHDPQIQDMADVVLELGLQGRAS
jgi:ATP-binding cassette, subfamily C, bacterial CydD